MTTETILSKQECYRIWNEVSATCFSSASQIPEFARAIEQAVLQSPEIQALRKDAERYRIALERISTWGRPWTEDDLYGRNWRGCAAEALRGGFDAAMEQQT